MSGEYEKAIKAAETSVWKKIEETAYACRKNGYTQPCSIVFSILEIRALERIRERLCP